MDGDTMDVSAFANIPLAALNVSCRKMLAIALNPEMPLPSSNGYSRNWQGLLELMGFPYETIKLLRQREDPTMTLLEFWEAEEVQPSVAKLLEFLQIIERFDVIDDILPLLERDAISYRHRVETKKRQFESINPIQDSAVSSAHTTAFCPITVDDVINPSMPMEVDGGTHDYKYDAYVSYVDNDIQFVLTLIDKLEKEYHLKLFVKERDMLPGIAESEAEIKMIHERCERILLIISPEFLSDPHCEFQTMFAQALGVDNNLYARKVIPVMYKPCQLPVRLKYIARVDYTKRDYFGRFWERLYSSIKCPPQGELPITTTGAISYMKSRINESRNASAEGDSIQGGPLKNQTNVDLKDSLSRAASSVTTLMPSKGNSTCNASLVSSFESSINLAKDESLIEMALISSLPVPKSQINIKPPKSKPLKKSPIPKTKLFQKLIGTTSNHNTT